MADPKINKLLTQYNFNDKNDISRIKYIVIHYVGATGDAKGNCNYFNTKYLGASAHYFVGFAGDIWQCVEDEDIAWHCGAKTYKHPECRNSNSIGIEMCVRNKGNLSANSKDWYFEDATVNATIELTKYLMKKYNVNVDHVIRHYDVTGKICPNPYVYNNTKHTWDDFKSAISKPTSSTVVATTPKIDINGLTSITGKSVATINQMINYIKKVNPSIDNKVIDMIPYYISEGEAEGIRGDISFAQSCIETGNFTFKGSAVTLDQNNFGGLGVTSKGMKGNSYATPQLGVRAMIQHLKAYANTEALNNPCIDVRFKYVSRGCAPYVEWLGIPENPNKKGWAAGSGYGSKILNVLKNIIGSSNVSNTTTTTNPIITAEELYRVRKTWENSAEQKGAFSNYVNAVTYAKKNPTYNVYDSKGNMVFSNSGYIVKVDISNLWIRKGPGTNFDKIKFTGVGKFTIVEEANGNGASKWGLLKSYSKDRNGWISLDYAKKV